MPGQGTAIPQRARQPVLGNVESRPGEATGELASLVPTLENEKRLCRKRSLSTAFHQHCTVSVVNTDQRRRAFAAGQRHGGQPRQQADGEKGQGYQASGHGSGIACGYAPDSNRPCFRFG